jgi:hypothetical protein
VAVTLNGLAAQAAEPFNYSNLPQADDETVMVVSEPSGDYGFDSRLQVQPPRSATVDERGKWIHCSGSTDKDCQPTDSSKDLLAWIIVPSCLESKHEICVEGLEVAAPSDELKPAKFIRSAVGGGRIAADMKMGLLEGSTPLLFEASNAPNASGSTGYAVLIQFTQHYNYATMRYEATSMMANVMPYKEVVGNYKATTFDPTAEPDQRLRTGGAVPECVWVEDGKCGMRQDFVEGSRAKVTFRMPTSIGGWFSGRMKDPTITIDPFSKTATLAKLEAQAVSVPKLAFVKKVADITVEKTFNIGRGGLGDRKGTFWSVMSGGVAGEDVFKFIDLYRESMKDTAAGVATYWNIYSIASGDGSGCLSDTSKVLGIASTNAMGYDSHAPSFERGFLNYKVGGLHYLPGGKELALGTYDLVMRSETARCLYGFSKAPISATVSVIGGDSPTVATTVVREKNGWLKLAAYGFTFSNKTLQVKMTQSSTAAQKTITCVKGKTSKKVTAVSPKCPSGFKKK